MNREELQNTIAKYYSNLPPKAKQIFAEMKWLEEIKNISQHYNMNSTQAELLGTETTLVLLGIISLTEYENILMRDLGLSKNMADQLVAEIDERILRNIRGELNTSYDQNLLDLAKQELEKGSEPESTEKSGSGVTVKIENKTSFGGENIDNDIKKIILESNYKDILYKISDENDLSIEQMGLLEEIINESFAGKISSGEFGSTVKQRLGLSEEKIPLLVSQINEKILKNVRAKIMEKAGNLNKTESKIEINQQDKEIMKNAGFEIEPNSANKVRQFNREDYKDSYMKNAGINIEKEKILEVKKEIPENKEMVLNQAGIKILNTEPEIKKSIFTNKLETQSINQTIETDHSVQDISNILNSKSKTGATDPYRMPIE